MKIRRAQAGDWDAVLALQEANLHDNLPAAERADGFLSVRFRREQFEQMNAGGAVVVAADGSRVTGYACCSTQAFNRGVLIIEAMVAAFPRLSLIGRPLASDATAIYGPVCVNRRDRGTGVFRAMSAGLKAELKGRFETAAGFIAKSNARSLSAHVEGARMSLVGEFDFGGQAYWIVAFAVPPEAISCVL